MTLASGTIVPLGRSATSSTFRRTGLLYDYALGSIGLLAGVSPETPATRQTAPYRKEQFDTSTSPGEQTLTNWWLRSQSSFHEGTGIKFMEPSSDDVVMNSFADSRGVNPWKAGELTLLKATVLKNASTVDTLVMGAIDGTTDVFFQAEGAVLTRETSAASAAVTWGGTGTIVSLAEDGTRYYAADATAIYRGTLAGGAGAVFYNTGNANVTIGWTKQRLVAGIGAAVYELTGAGPGLPAALYTHPSAAWKWTGIAEGGAAIYAAGYAGAQSAIYKFTLSTAGVMPTLTSGVIATNLPTGEIVHSISAYIGTYMAIGTNKGVRIATISETGDLDYGPLVIESTQPVLALHGYDRFIYAACTGQIGGLSGLWRIDLGTDREDGTFPYATDLQAGVAGTVNSVSVLGASGRLVFGVSAAGSYLESATDLVASGYVRTGYVRFNTLEPKQFLYVQTRMLAPGSVATATYDAVATESTVSTLTTPATGNYSLGRPESEEYLALKFTLTQATATTGPTLAAWQIRALPATGRSRLIRVPFLLFENMRDSKGTALPPVDVGGVLASLEALESTAAPVLFTDLCHGVPRSELVVVEEIDFRQISPPTNCQGNGGLAYITLRTVL